jgi:hypothetical protein
MRIKYLGTKVVLVFLTLLATPVVWASLAWPEWSAASPAVEDFVAVDGVAAAPQPEPVIQVQQVIHRIIVVPRYIEIEATPSAGRPLFSSSPPPASTPASAPAPGPTVIMEAVDPSSQRQAQVQAPQQTVSSGSSGPDGGGASSSSAGSSTSSSSSSPATSSGAASSQPSGNGGGSGSQSTTKGS